MASSAGFWTSAMDREPKRQYRFLVRIGSMPDGATWYAKKATKPAIEITVTEHQFLNHTFKYPGRAKWNTVDVTLVDPVSPDASINLSRVIYEAGYAPPANVNDTTTISKVSAVAALQGVVIEQIDAAGNAIETWTLNNPFITNVKYGDLDYSGDDMTEVSITFAYDWASIEVGPGQESAQGPTSRGAPSRKYWSESV